MSGLTLFILGIVVAFLPTLFRVARDVFRGRSAQELRRRRRGQPSEYDGHEDYLEEVETPQARLAMWILEPIDMAVALLGGLCIARWLNVPGPSVAAVGPLGMPFLLFSGFVLLLATGLIFALMRTVHESRNRLYTYPAVIAVFIFGFLLPLQKENREASAVADARADIIASLESNSDAARAKWHQDVMSANARGGMGAEPPMLEVEQREDTVLVTNITDKRIETVCLARVVRDSQAYDGYSRCALRDKSTRRECPGIGAQGQIAFELEERRKQSNCAQGQFEFRVGDYMRPEPSWWSDTGLVWFDRHQQDLARQR